jgi:hypothetical protein
MCPLGAQTIRIVDNVQLFDRALSSEEIAALD